MKGIILNTVAIIAIAMCVSTSFADEGVPESEWNQMERDVVTQTRAEYKKQGLPFSDQDAAQVVLQMRKQMAKMAANAATIQALSRGAYPQTNMQQAVQPQPQVLAQPPITEDQLVAEIGALPAKQGGVIIERRRDGFSVNGRPYVDAEGTIVNFAFDPISGDIGYIVNAPTGPIIKLLRAGSNSPGIAIAKASRSSTGWQVLTTTGKTLSGYSVSVLANGFLVIRDTAAFKYEPGKGVTNIAAPEGFRVASLQRGNVGSTGYILLERDYSKNSPGGLGSLMGGLKVLGSDLGVGTKKEDYALMNIETGQLHLLNIPVEGKEVTVMSDCQRQTAVTNKCNQMDTFNSLYEKNGPNYSHYFWRIDWMRTPHGPLAISHEDGSRNIYVTDLATGRKVVAFNRTLGIQYFESAQNENGKVSVSASYAFADHRLDDVDSLLQKPSDTPVNASPSDQNTAVPAEGEADSSSKM